MNRRRGEHLTLRSDTDKLVDYINMRSFVANSELLKNNIETINTTFPEFTTQILFLLEHNIAIDSRYVDVLTEMPDITYPEFETVKSQTQTAYDTIQQLGVEKFTALYKYADINYLVISAVEQLKKLDDELQIFRTTLENLTPETAHNYCLELTKICSLEFEQTPDNQPFQRLRSSLINLTSCNLESVCQNILLEIINKNNLPSFETAFKLISQTEWVPSRSFLQKLISADLTFSSESVRLASVLSLTSIEKTSTFLKMRKYLTAYDQYFPNGVFSDQFFEELAYDENWECLSPIINIFKNDPNFEKYFSEKYQNAFKFIFKTTPPQVQILKRINEFNSLLETHAQSDVRTLLLLGNEMLIKISLHSSPEIKSAILVGVLGLQIDIDSADTFYGVSQSPQKATLLPEKLIVSETISSEFQERARHFLNAIDLFGKGATSFENDLLSGEVSFRLFEASQQLLHNSAATIEIYHHHLQRSRTIEPFIALLGRKAQILFNEKLLTLTEKSTPEKLEKAMLDTIQVIMEAIRIFNNTARDIVPHLRTMNSAIQEEVFQKGVWFNGRDGIPLELSLRASLFGSDLGNREQHRSMLLPMIYENPEKRSAILLLARKKRESDFLPTDIPEDQLLEEGIELFFATQARIYDFVKHIAISRPLLDNAKTEAQIAELKKFLLQKGISTHMLAVDSGYRGSVIIKVLKIISDSDTEYLDVIRLLNSRDPALKQIISEQVSVDVANLIEALPKHTDRTFYLTTDLKPIQQPFSPEMQVLAWASEHAIFRNTIPKIPETPVEIEQAALSDIEKECAAHMHTENPNQVEKESATIQELYTTSKKEIAPTIVAFADSVLKEFAKSKNPGKVLFLARDGLGPFQAAQALLEKFPNHYKGVTKDKLLYVHLTRKLVGNTPPETLRTYLQQEGVVPGDEVTLVDVGMYGTMLSDINRTLSELATVKKVQYLVSRTSNASGFLDDQHHPLPSLNSIVGNKAIHFLEDTFSGTHPSATALELQNGQLQPNTLEQTYATPIMLRRKYASRAITDYVQELAVPPTFTEQTRQQINTFLSDTQNFEHLMVPHE